MTREQTELEKVIRRRAAADPRETWLKWKNSTASWAELLSNCQRAANGLLELGANPGERIAILLPNCPEFLWTYIGSVFIGATPVPVNISQRGVTLEHVVVDSDATIAICNADLASTLSEVQHRCPALRTTVIVDGKGERSRALDFDRVMAGADTEPSVAVAGPVGAVGLMYTSGTTGPPKGVVATGYDLSLLEALLSLSNIQPGDTMYTPLPLYHGNALLASAFGSILAGAKLALGERFSASRFFDECRRYEAATFNTLGGMISILLKQPPRGDDADNPVRVVLSAGCPPDRWTEFEQRFGVRIIEWFGMVDSPGWLVNSVGRIGSMGVPLAGVEFRVVDEDDRTLPPGVVGELLFRHPKGQLTHYHKRPDATAQAYRGGWFHTGDLAECDNDGFFYYRGRKRESMRRLGENISAWEIETVLNQHPAVLESAAHAVPSDLGEDEVKVVVVMLPGCSLSPMEVLEYCTERMAKHAVPRFVEFVDSLPKTPSERIQYEALRARGVTSETWDRDLV